MKKSIRAQNSFKMIIKIVRVFIEKEKDEERSKLETMSDEWYDLSMRINLNRKFKVDDQKDKEQLKFKYFDQIEFRL